jgi:acetoin utilization protein AcuB
MNLSKLKRIPTIKAVMTPFPYSIQIDASILEAQSMMEQHDIHHLPVVDQDKLVSVVSARAVRLAAAGDSKRPLRSICVTETYIVGTDAPLDRVLLHLANRHIDSALVVKDDRLAGIFTLTDACRAFGEFLQAMFPEGDDDQAA